MGLKIKIGADSSELRKELNEANKSIRNFEKDGSGALQSLGNAIGVDIQRLQTLGDAFKGAGTKIAKSLGAGNEAIVAMGTSLKVLGGLAGAAGATLALVWRNAKREAEIYYSTVEGRADKAALESFKDTYSALAALQGGGSGTRGIMEWFSRGFAKLKSEVPVFLQNLLTGDTKGMATQLLTLGFRSDQADRAAAVMRDIVAIENEMLDKRGRIADLTMKINEEQLKSRDQNLSLDEQLKAQDNVVALTAEKFQYLYDLEMKRYNLLVEYNSLAPTSLEDKEKEVASYERAVGYLSEMYSRNREFLENSRRIQLAWQAIVKSLDEAAQKAALEEVTGVLQGTSEGLDADMYASVAADMAVFQRNIQTWIEENPITIEPIVSTEQAKQQIMDLMPVLTAFGESVAVSIGGLAGDLIKGEDAWGNFASSALSAFGDMAIAVGRLAISTGVATLGIKAALASLNGWVAIAAGAALIALGSAVRTSASNIASGSYSATPSVSSNYGSSVTSSFGDFYERNLSIEITGTLKAEGSTLTAVLNNENNRQRRTT